MPEAPASLGSPTSDSDPDVPTEPSCASCDHFDTYHEDKSGPCTLPGCGCEQFVGESEVETAEL
jgi:hypothetical protein